MILIKTKILLASLNIFGYHSLALAFIASYFLNKEIKNKVELKIKNIPLGYSLPNMLFTESFKNHLIDCIKEFKPDIIGFSCYIWNFKHTLSLCKEIKEINPNTLIVLGGPHVSTASQTKEILSQNSSVDVIVRNEGEVTFYEIVKHLVDNNKNFSDILGITYREENVIKTNSERPILNDLDEIPSPYLSGVYEKYIANENSKHLKFFDDTLVVLETSRGCLFHCAYCFYPKGTGGRMRYFSLERLREEMRYITKHIKNAYNIYFVDSLMNTNKVRMIQLCGVISEENTNHTRVTFQIHPDILDKDMIDNLAKLDIEWLECGVQTTNQKTMSIIHREYNTERLARNIKSLQQKKLKVRIDLILGLPQDNLSGFKETLNNIISLKPDIIECFLLYLLPGTELYELRNKYHYEFDENEMNKVISCDTWPKEEIEKGIRLWNLVFEYTEKRMLSKSFFSISDWHYWFKRAVFNFNQYSLKKDLKTFFIRISQLLFLHNRSF